MLREETRIVWRVLLCLDSDHRAQPALVVLLLRWVASDLQRAQENLVRAVRNLSAVREGGTDRKLIEPSSVLERRTSYHTAHRRTDLKLGLTSTSVLRGTKSNSKSEPIVFTLLKVPPFGLWGKENKPPPNPR